MTPCKQADMSRNTNALTFVRMKKPTWTNRLCQKAGIMTGVFRSDQCSPNTNPEDLNLRKTSDRNGVTNACALQHSWSRCQLHAKRWRDCPRSKCRRESRRIRRRGHDNVKGKDTSRS